MKLIQILEALNYGKDSINASFFMKDARERGSLYRIMSIDELSNIFADDWSRFLSFKEDSKGSVDKYGNSKEIDEYKGYSHFKSFAYKISKKQFREWIDDDSVIVEFDFNTIANLVPGKCELLPYVFEKGGTKEYEFRLCADSSDPLGKLGTKAIDAIKAIYVPASRAKFVVSQFDVYFDMEEDNIDYIIVNGI